jgi:hypothetical protein
MSQWLPPAQLMNANKNVSEKKNRNGNSTAKMVAM